MSSSQQCVRNFVYVIHDLHHIIELLFTANNVNN